MSQYLLRLRAPASRLITNPVCRLAALSDGSEFSPAHFDANTAPKGKWQIQVSQKKEGRFYHTRKAYFLGSGDGETNTSSFSMSPPLLARYGASTRFFLFWAIICECSQSCDRSRNPVFKMKVFLVWFASNVSPLLYEPLFCLSFCVFSRRSGDMAMRGVYTLRKPLGLRLRIRQAALIRIRLSEKRNRIWQECQEHQAADTTRFTMLERPRHNRTLLEKNDFKRIF